MNFTDPIILTAYLLCISYCIYRIINAFNDEFTIRLDDEALNNQLAEQGLQDIIGISFSFDKQYEFDKLTKLKINISNKSSDYSVYVDWDYSAFTDLEGRARRVARLAPGTTLDLFQNQVFSTIAPNMTLKEEITAEDLLQRKDAPAQDFKAEKPLIDPDKLKKNGKFMKRYADLELRLGLAFRVTGTAQTFSGDRAYVLCKLILRKLPWQAGLPWTPRK